MRSTASPAAPTPTGSGPIPQYDVRVDWSDSSDEFGPGVVQAPLDGFADERWHEAFEWEARIALQPQVSPPCEGISLDEDWVLYVEGVDLRRDPAELRSFVDGLVEEANADATSAAFVEALRGEVVA